MHLSRSGNLARYRSDPHLPEFVVPPAVGHRRFRQGTGEVSANRELRDALRESGYWSRSLSPLSSAISKLSRPVGPPAFQATGLEQGARVPPTDRHLRSVGNAPYLHRDETVRLRAVAELSMLVASPASDGPIR